MNAIRDFRSVLGAADIEAVKARVDGGTRRSKAKPLVAYVNHGRWVADCLCGSGVACAPDVAEAVCLACGTICRVKFPTAKAIAAVASVLASRPVSRRNWHPEHEKRADLAAENLLHGLAPEGNS